MPREDPGVNADSPMRASATRDRQQASNKQFMKRIQSHAKPGLSKAELKGCLRVSHALVAAGLPKRRRTELGLQALARDITTTITTTSTGWDALLRDGDLAA